MTLSNPLTIITNSEEETEKVGALLASHIMEGITILLTGDLGAGKTTLVRGFCQALGYKKVRSPSFTLVNHYQTQGRRIVHSDLYRLQPEDIDDLALMEEDFDDAVIFIEWAEKGDFITERPLWQVRISLVNDVDSPESRILEFLARNPEGERALSAFEEVLKRSYFK